MYPNDLNIVPEDNQKHHHIVFVVVLLVVLLAGFAFLFVGKMNVRPKKDYLTDQEKAKILQSLSANPVPLSDKEAILKDLEIGKVSNDDREKILRLMSR